MNSKSNLYLLFFTILLSLNVRRSSAECERTGIVCSSTCEKIVLCLSIGGTENEIEDCTTTNKFCEEDSSGKATCSASTNEFCRNKGTDNIICGAVADFPHPTDCSRSIECSSLGAPPSQDCYCQSGSIVDITLLSLPCTTTGADNPCNRQCDPNTNQLAIGSYCYACTDNGYIAYICPSFKYGYNDSGNNLNITRENPKAGTGTDKTCMNHDTGSSSSTSSSAPPSPSTSTTPSAPPTCSKEGDTFPDPSDCHNYYWCNANLIPELKRCREGRYFYGGQCVDGKCQ